MLQIAVCDGDEIMGEKLKQLIESRLQKEGDYRVLAFSTGRRLLESGIHFDIYFLDIDLKDINGIDMARRLRQGSEAVIVFVTALKEYIFDAFDVQAFQYLLKPIDEQKFFQVLDKAVAECKIVKQSEPLVIRVKGVYQNVPKENILYAENDARKIILHLRGEQIDRKSVV